MRSVALAAIFLCALTSLAFGQGQPLTVFVVPSCGTGTSGYTPTQNRLATMDTTGHLCTSGSGGGSNVATRLVLSGTTDISTTADGAILWASAATSGKSQSVYSCGSSNSGNALVIKDELGTAGTYAITLTPVTGTIDGSATYVMNFNFQSASLVCDGAGNWALE